MNAEKANSSRLADLDGIESLRLGHNDGVSLDVLNLGAIIQRLEVPGGNGGRANVVLGYSDPANYLTVGPYFGAVVGRYANRIGKGRFQIEGRAFELPLNNGPNHLHGGPDGFNLRLWSVDEERSVAGRVVSLTMVSDDGDQGYPGRLLARVTYSLESSDTLTIDYEATTDRPTIVNLSQHTYFNLCGGGSGSAMGHELRLNASHYTPVDQDLIPTGEIAPVEGTPFDFRSAKQIDRDIRCDHPQLRVALGFDHNFVIDRPEHSDGALVEVANLVDPESGRSLAVASTEPGVQFYSGNFLNGSEVGSGGRAYRQGDGVALETQHFPDSPNQPAFPSTVLMPGEVYRSRTVWRFGW